MPDINLHDEKMLFRQIAQGDETAFRQIFDFYKERLCVFIFRITKSEFTANEIVQDIFVKLWVNRSSLAKVDNPGAYIFTMARNKTVDSLRKVASEARLLNQLWQTINKFQQSSEAHLHAKESEELINEAVFQLSPQKQKIFVMSRYEGLNHDQIALRMSLSKSTVKNHLVDVLKHIRTYMVRHSELLVILSTSSFYCLFQ